MATEATPARHTPSSVTNEVPATVTEQIAPSMTPTLEPTETVAAIPTVTIAPLEQASPLAVLAQLSAASPYVWQCKLSLAWSPDSQTLAYVGSEGGIWRAAAPDFSPTQWTERGIQPVWSPDGRLATVWAEADTWVLQVVDTSRTVQARSNLPGERTLAIDRWLDSDRLTLVIHRGSSVEVLHEVTLSQQVNKPLVSPEEGELSSTLAGGEFHWSPNGAYLLVERPTPVLPGQITVIEVLSHAETALAQFEEPRHQRFETWSPDSTRFLYEQWDDPNVPLLETVPSLFVWNVAAEQSQHLLPNVWGADWSAREEIAFLLLGDPLYDNAGQITSTTFQSGQPFTLNVGAMDSNTSEIRFIAPAGQVSDVTAFREGADRCGTPRPLWSPDGAQFVFWDADGQAWLYNTDGKLVQLLSAQQVAWSPDSLRLAVQSEDNISILCARDGC